MRSLSFVRVCVYIKQDYSKSCRRIDVAPNMDKIFRSHTFWALLKTIKCFASQQQEPAHEANF